MSWASPTVGVASRRVSVLPHARARLLSRFRLAWEPRDWKRALNARKEKVRRVDMDQAPAHILLDGHIVAVVRPQGARVVSVATVLTREMSRLKGFPRWV